MFLLLLFYYFITNLNCMHQWYFSQTLCSTVTFSRSLLVIIQAKVIIVSLLRYFKFAQVYFIKMLHNIFDSFRRKFPCTDKLLHNLTVTALSVATGLVQHFLMCRSRNGNMQLVSSVKLDKEQYDVPYAPISKIPLLQPVNKVCLNM